MDKTTFNTVITAHVEPEIQEVLKAVKLTQKTLEHEYDHMGKFLSDLLSPSKVRYNRAVRVLHATHGRDE